MAGAAVLALFACSSRNDSPEGVLRQFLAASDGPRASEKRWELLAAESRLILENEASRLRVLSQGAVNKSARDLIDVLQIQVAAGERPATIEEASTRVVLRVALAKGGSTNVTLVREDGRWRVVVPLDPASRIPLVEAR
ncbi:MAG: hypothetical protein HYY84_15195 [Deltaproteobacteria bacterium]|nr:hypothetical protein [Deltaproteobacteria bacterium]